MIYTHWLVGAVKVSSSASRYGQPLAPEPGWVTLRPVVGARRFVRA